MSCQISVWLDSDQADAAARLREVPRWFAAWEQTFSRFQPDSELNQVNARAGTCCLISEDFAAVLGQALAEAQWSEGLVTPAVGTALRQAGYDRSFEQLPKQRPSVMPMPAPVADWRCIEFQAASRRLRLPTAMSLDFGGIAKGWCADQTMRRLADFGAVLVDAGGDIAVSGLWGQGQAWTVGLADPLADGQDVAQIQMSAGGLATSGRDLRQWQMGGRSCHHIIDPRTGAPAQTDVLCATVAAPNAVRAETAAKMLLIQGSRAGLAWLDTQTELAACMMTQQGQRLDSCRWGADYPAKQPIDAHSFTRPKP